MWAFPSSKPERLTQMAKISVCSRESFFNSQSNDDDDEQTVPTGSRSSAYHEQLGPSPDKQIFHTSNT
jgi:hypothetical protein